MEQAKMRDMDSIGHFYKAYFHPGKADARDIPIASCPAITIMGLGQIVLSMTAAGSPFLKNGILLSGLAVTTGGLTGKSGFVYLAGISWITAGLSQLAKPAGTKLASLYGRNIKPMIQNKLWPDSAKPIQT